MTQVSMSVYASSGVEIGHDGVHRPIDYAIAVLPGADPSPANVVIHETAGDRRFRVRITPQLQFQLLVWTTDDNVDPSQSWVRCTFRPAHDVGVSSVTSPLNEATTNYFLEGNRLSSLASNPELASKGADWGLEDRAYTGIWSHERSSMRLQNPGVFEIAVQVGLHYTDGNRAYCKVDPEMDLEPEAR